MRNERGLYRQPNRWVRRLLGAVVLSAALGVAAVVALNMDDDRVGVRLGATPVPSAPADTPSPTPPVSFSPTPVSSSPAAGECGAIATDCADGMAGWSGRLGSCTQAAVPSEERAPAPDLDVDVQLAAPSYRTGDVIRATMRLTNNGSTVARFTTYDNSDDGTLLREDAALSAVHTSGSIVTTTWEIPPGQTHTAEVTIRTRACGDTSADPGEALTAGTYQLVAWLRWADDAAGGRIRYLVAPAVGVALTD